MDDLWELAQTMYNNRIVPFAQNIMGTAPQAPRPPSMESQGPPLERAHRFKVEYPCGQVYADTKDAVKGNPRSR